jgi:hypothetical protein
MIQNQSHEVVSGSCVYDDSAKIDLSPLPRPFLRPSVAVLEGDPIDGALDWQRIEGIRCPLVNAANVTKPGGDWETISIGPEENLARRSNLVPLLQTKYGTNDVRCAMHPISPNGGIYTPSVGKDLDWSFDPVTDTIIQSRLPRRP